MNFPHDCDPESVPELRGPSWRNQDRRLIGIDVARGLALIGMMAIHILPPAKADGTMSTAWLLADGKSAALFAVLAGVGIALSTGRTRLPQGRRWAGAAVSLVLRALLIGAIGLALGYAVPIAVAVVILPYYAVLFVLAIPFIRVRPVWLFLLAGLVALVVPVLSHVWRSGMPEADLRNPVFADVRTDPGGLLEMLGLTGVFPALPWLAYVLVGLAVGRSALALRRVAAQMALGGAALATLASGGSWYLMERMGGQTVLTAEALRTMSLTEYADTLVWGANGTLPTTSPWWLALAAPHSTTPFDLLFTIGVALAAIGVSIMLGRVIAPILAPLAAAGSMPLTLYAAHLLLLVTPFAPTTPGVAFVSQIVLLGAFAMWWRARFSRGPLEQVVSWPSAQITRRIAGGKTARRADTGESSERSTALAKEVA